jgi:hypothetical protein
MKIIINGTIHDLDVTNLTYDNLISLAGFEDGRIVSITYKSKKVNDTQRTGILLPGCSVEVEDGMVFNAFDTGSA